MARREGANSFTDGPKRFGTHKPPVLDGVGVLVGVAVAVVVGVAVRVAVAVAVGIGLAVGVGLGLGVNELLLLELHPPRAMLSPTTIKREPNRAAKKRTLSRDVLWLSIINLCRRILLRSQT